MTPHEREELLKLWAEVPECKAKGMHIFRSCWFGQNQLALSDDHAAAIARDAMVEFLIDSAGGVLLFQDAKKTTEILTYNPDDFTAKTIARPSASRLLALIAACRKIAGKP